MNRKSSTYKKLLTATMASTLVFSSFASQVGATSNKDQESKFVNVLSTEKASKIKALEKDTSKLKDLATDPSKQLRVIIEVEGQSTLELANKKGVSIKDLSQKEVSDNEKVLSNKHDTLKANMQAKGIIFKQSFDYTTAFNGIAGEVRAGDFEKLKTLSNVTNVYIANEYQKPEVTVDMTTSHEFIQSYQTWADAKYKGEGMVIAVIDSGVDPSHKDFVLSSTDTADLTSELVQSKIDSKELTGQFYTDKVPFGYNYADKNNTILDLGPDASMHGMHVAGTAAANGDTENGGIKGVAPEAQILGMKVFSNDPNYPSTYSDIYLAAIEDSIKLGADVLNMSLGSVASFYNEDSAEDKAITNAVQNGIVASVSAGNSGTIGYGYDNPFYKNPDYGLVGAPGLNKDTLQVAATGNAVYEFEHEGTVGELTFKGYGVDDWSSIDMANTVSLKSLTNDPSALGGPNDYKNIDVTGKVVLIERGEYTFYDKTINAKAAGAAGVIVYNSSSPVFFKDQGGWGIPFMKIDRAAGLELETLLAEESSLEVEINQTAKVEGPEVGRATDFTSWGVTPDLEFKPEISAPGGNILSTLQNDQYGLMSGTSMAAPHVAGGAALVQQYLQSTDKYSNLDTEESTRLAKKLLMNTAKVTTDLEGEEISPRRQGAGMMQTFAAVSTPVVVSDKSTDEAKVNLKDFTGDSFTFTLTAENMTGVNHTYQVDTSVLVDKFEEYDSLVYNQLLSGNLKDAVVTAPESITVPANGSVDFTIKVDISKGQVPGLNNDGEEIYKALEEDVFIEGFVKLVAENKANPDLTVPYLSFYGEWDRPEIFDTFGPVKEEEGFYDYIRDFNDFTDALDPASGFLSPVEVDGESVYTFSPNGDGALDQFLAVPSLLRNAKELTTTVEDTDGNIVSTVSKENNVRKSFYNGGNGLFYSFNGQRTWDGKSKSTQVADGLYTYKISGKVDYENAVTQTYELPVLVDTVAPEATISYDKEQNELSLDFSDEGSGAADYAIYINGEKIHNDFLLVKESNVVNLDTYNVDSESVSTIEIVAFDFALNGDVYTAAVGDTTEPVILLDDAGPEPLGFYTTKTIPIKGIVEDDSLKTLTVNGKPIPFVYDAVKEGYTFDSTITVDNEGKNSISIEATDYNNNSISIIRDVFVDVTAPTLFMELPKVVNSNVEQFTFDVVAKDNFNMFTLELDGEPLFVFDDFTPSTFTTEFMKTIPVTVSLIPGANTFTLRGIDGFGNSVSEEFTITRSESELRSERLSGPSRYETAVALSKEGWSSSNKVVLARGDQYADALAGVPFAAKEDAPLLLTTSSKLHAETLKEIERLKAKEVVILGGTGAISDSVMKSLSDKGIKVTRISGKDRYETAAKIAEKFTTASEAVVVSGENFPDALSAASYAAIEGMPIVLSRQSAVPFATKAVLTKLKVSNTLVIGGTSALSSQVEKDLPKAFRISGKSRYETSLAVAKYFDNLTDEVFIADGSNYADALAGGALAAKKGTGLFIVPKTLPTALGEYLHQEDVDYATIIGGTKAVSEELRQQLGVYLSK
ncbi:cell wall-binding repeat-containing protein [Chryseomicrobium palamuruense]